MTELKTDGAVVDNKLPDSSSSSPEKSLLVEDPNKSVEAKTMRHMRPGGKIAASIIIGSLIILGGIIYQTHALTGRLDEVIQSFSRANLAAAPSQIQGSQAQAPAAQPVAISDRANQPVMGSSSAKVTLVEFGDFQCPFCKQYFQQAFSQIKSQYIDTGKIKYEFRNFPLTQIHVNAEISSIAAECANQQGQFWPYFNILYTNGQADGTGLASQDLINYANQLGLNKGVLGIGANKFNTCLDGKKTQSIVDADEQLGTQVGVSGTPSFVILKSGDNTVDAAAIRQDEQSNQSIITLPNGNMFIVGAQPFSVFQQALDSALK